MDSAGTHAGAGTAAAGDEDEDQGEGQDDLAPKRAVVVEAATKPRPIKAGPKKKKRRIAPTMLQPATN